MPIQTVCSHCLVKIKVKDELIGKAIKCPKCGERLAVVASGSEDTMASGVVQGELPAEYPGTTDQPTNAAALAAEVTGELGQDAHPAAPAIASAAEVTGELGQDARPPAPAVVSAAEVTGELGQDARPAAPAIASAAEVTGELGQDARPSAPAVEHTELVSAPDIDSSVTQALDSAPDTGPSAAREAHGAGDSWSLGDYLIVRELGQGGMGTVYEAEDAKLKRRVALKVMKPDIAKNPRHRERFVREARTAAKVKSDFICPIYRVGEDNGIPFIAMPFLKGEPLDSHLKQGIRLPMDEVLRIGKEVAQGLKAAHEVGLVHRDIKPANVWLETQRSGPARAIILDFGLARMQADDVHITQSGAIIGTPAFMSPEQARGDKQVDARTDLFSLGCVLYVLCTGELPFKSETTMGVLMALATHDPTPPHHVTATVPKPLSRLIMRLLAKRPDDRPQTASEVIDEFVEIEANPATPAQDAFTTQLEPAQPSDASADTRDPRSGAAGSTATRQRQPAATSARMSTTSYVLVGLVGLALLGCVAPLAGVGVYFIVVHGGKELNLDLGGLDKPAQDNAAQEKPPPPPTGEVPKGWVVVESLPLGYAVAMPQQPVTQAVPGGRFSTLQLPNGTALAVMVQPLQPADLTRPGGPSGALDQLMVTLLMRTGVVRPGGQVAAATRITAGDHEGRQLRLSSGPIVNRGYVGIQFENGPGGAKITSVAPDGPAAKAGLKVNDMVYEAGGRKTPNRQVLDSTIQSHKMGDELLFKVKRGQENLELKVTVLPVPPTDQYVRAYLVGKHIIMLMGPAQGDAFAPETSAFFNSLKLRGGGQVPEAEAKLPIHEVGQGLEQRGKLDVQTAERVYRVKLEAGTSYVIDMVTPNQPALDPFLVLTDAAGKHLAQDDDSGGNLNARIVFRPEQSGTFRIIATSFNSGTGAYTLTVRPTADAPKKVKQ